MINPDVLGRGLAFPLDVDARGGLRRSTEAQKVRESILMILGTQHHERVMRPTFGCNLQSLVFASNNTATADLARHYVEEGLTRWEPRILLVKVLVKNDHGEGCLLISVHYKLKSTYEAQNLVYPFYLDARQ
jgi:phage baseplate assembly protein W